MNVEGEDRKRRILERSAVKTYEMEKTRLGMM